MNAQKQLDAARKKEIFCEEWGPIFRYDSSRDLLVCRRCDGEFRTIEGARVHGTWTLENKKMLEDKLQNFQRDRAARGTK